MSDSGNNNHNHSILSFIDVLMVSFQNALKHHNYSLLHHLLNNHILSLGEVSFKNIHLLLISSGIIQFLTNIINKILNENEDNSNENELVGTAINCLIRFANTKFQSRETNIRSTLLQNQTNLQTSNNINQNEGDSENENNEISFLSPVPIAAISTILPDQLSKTTEENLVQIDQVALNDEIDVEAEKQPHNETTIIPNDEDIIHMEDYDSISSNSHNTNNNNSNSAEHSSKKPRTEKNEEIPPLEPLEPVISTSPVHIQVPKHRKVKKRQRVETEVIEDEEDDVEVTGVADLSSSIIINSSFVDRDRFGSSRCLVPNCEKSGIWFGSDAELQHHMKISHNCVICFGCGEKFISEAQLSKHHFSNIHRANQSLERLTTHLLMCHYCGRDFAKSARHHIGIHEKPYQCLHCTKRFSRSTVLRIHVNNKHTTKQIENHENDNDNNNNNTNINRSNNKILRTIPNGNVNDNEDTESEIEEKDVQSKSIFTNPVRRLNSNGHNTTNRNSNYSDREEQLVNGPERKRRVVNSV